MPSGYVKCNAKRNKNQQNGAESEGEAAAPLNHFWRAFNIQESNHTRSGSNHLQHATPAFVSPIRGDVMNRQEKGGANRSKIVTTSLIKMVILEPNFKWHFEAFASELFKYTLHIQYLNI